ncbi:MAG: SIMPL domain-containing protein [Gammaproteobacteria bacterium]|nr:SIMPL domain-containing protein [Gammaproteobacteria bacterium]
MTRFTRRVVLLVATVFWGAAAVSAGAAATEGDLQYNQIRFQAAASESVANDRMQAVLAVQDEDDDAAQLADRINQTMAWALEQSKGQQGIDVRSGGYSTQPVYNKNALSGWRASQQLILEGSDFSQIGKLIGVLQQRLQLSAVSFSVAPDTRAAVERKLIDQALDSFKQRAEQVRKNIGTPGYRIVELSINTEDMPIQPYPVMRAEVMSVQSVAEPRFEGGDSDVRVSVQGLIQLQ